MEEFIKLWLEYSAEREKINATITEGLSSSSTMTTVSIYREKSFEDFMDWLVVK